MKKFIVSSDVLRRGLKQLAPAINKKSPKPELLNVFMRITKGELEMIASDLELTIFVKIAIETREEFDMLVPFEFVNEIVGLVRSAPVTIGLPSARTFEIVDGDDIYKHSGLCKVEDYPKLPDVPKRTAVELPENFIDILTRSMNTVLKTDGRPDFKHAQLEILKDRGEIITTDGEAMFTHKIELGSQNGEKILISQKFASAVHSMTDAKRIAWTQNQVAIMSDTVTVCATRSEEKFPDLTKILTCNQEANLVLNRSQLVEALKKVCITKLSIKETVFNLKRDQGKIHLETKDPGAGIDIKAAIPGAFLGDTDLIRINSAKLLIMMEQIQTESVRLHIEAHDKKIMITSEDNKDYLGMIAPLKVNQ
jgi:DNA polymerase-3 subunit beta